MFKYIYMAMSFLFINKNLIMRDPTEKVYLNTPPNYKFTKRELCSLYILQDKILNFLIFQNLQNFQKNRMYFGIVGLFCTMNRYVEYRIRILCILLYMRTYFKYVSTLKIEISRPPQIEQIPRSISRTIFYLIPKFKIQNPTAAAVEF